MAARIFAVLAAVFLVVAVGVAALTPWGLTLGTAILQMDRSLLESARASSPPWLWTSVEQPFLLRPLWLLPAMLGVVCAGIAATLNSGNTSTARRRRS